MGVYIKGMKMPESCDDCRIMMLEDTNCVPELYCGCPIVFKAHPQGVGHRPDYCPLVPVPPHGRLIDADALCEKLEKAMKIKPYLEGAFNAAISFALIAPTIIPAEEGET